MGDSDPLADFKNARATMRETAKWIISGGGALIVLVVGASTVSSLGTMSWDRPRLWAALFSAALGFVLCWAPFTRAVTVLRPESIPLRNFAHPPDQKYRNVRDKVGDLLNGQLPMQYPSIEVFSDYVEALRISAFNQDQAIAAPALARFKQAKPLHDVCLQMCLTEYTGSNFDELIDSVKRRQGPVIIAAFIAFAYLANPPKDEETGKAIATPELLDIPSNAFNDAVFADAKVASGCFKPGAKMVAIEDLPGKRVSGVLAPRAGEVCERTRLTLMGDGRIAIP